MPSSIPHFLQTLKFIACRKFISFKILFPNIYKKFPMTFKRRYINNKKKKMTSISSNT